MGGKRWGLGTKKGLLGWLAKIFLDVVMITSTSVLDLDYFTKTYVCFIWFLVFMLYLTIKILKNRNHSPGGILFSSVQFSRSVVSESVRPHESQHTRPPCPSPNPRVHSNSRPSSQWCHPAISSSVVPFSSCPQSLPASESFPMS